MPSGTRPEIEEAAFVVIVTRMERHDHRTSVVVVIALAGGPTSCIGPQARRSSEMGNE
jgi:hypothetical protein